MVFSRVFENRETLLQVAISLAEIIAKKSPIATQGSKINLNYARDHNVDDSFSFIVRLISENIRKEKIKCLKNLLSEHLEQRNDVR